MGDLLTRLIALEKLFRTLEERVSVLESITGDHQTIIDRLEEMEEGLDDIVDE